MTKYTLSIMVAVTLGLACRSDEDPCKKFGDHRFQDSTGDCACELPFEDVFEDPVVQPPTADQLQKDPRAFLDSLFRCMQLQKINAAVVD